MSIGEGALDLFTDFIATAFGWAFCMAMLAGAYVIGFALAQHFGGAEHRDTFGLLSAIMFIWLYEHRRAMNAGPACASSEAANNNGSV